MTAADVEVAFETHKDAVYGFAWRMSGSAAEAEDITQEVFVTLLRHPDRFDAGEEGETSTADYYARYAAPSAGQARDS